MASMKDKTTDKQARVFYETIMDGLVLSPGKVLFCQSDHTAFSSN